MPIIPPALDDRSFNDLVEELLARIPAHTPEWTNPRLGDPGRTLIELFAWLTDTLLYRVNLIPERQRLAFLRLLGEQMRPARPATGLVALASQDLTQALYLQGGATIQGPVNFETRAALTVLPVTGQAYYKRPLSDDEQQNLQDVIEGLQTVYELGQAKPKPYVTTPVFADGAEEANGFDLIQQTVDKSLWIALLAPKPELVDAVKTTLGHNEFGGQQILSLGFSPARTAPTDSDTLFEEVSAATPLPHVWEISAGQDRRGNPVYLTLDSLPDLDTTAGLTQRGVQRLALPAADKIGVLTNDARTDFKAGLGDRPPRLDDNETAARLVAWLRLRPTQRLTQFALGWSGVNAVEIDQRQTVVNRIVGQSDGTADQVLPLPGQSVEGATLQIQVEEARRGFQPWVQVDDLAQVGRDTGAFSLDSQAGSISFGDGVRGRIPGRGARVKVAQLRAGGGSAGNLPPGSLQKISNAKDLANKPVNATLKVQQSLATVGGAESETLDEAEKRIPQRLRHQQRAVTVEDYQQLAFDTPGVRVGRVEVLPRFKPHQHRSNVPGVVSVMVWPFKEPALPPAPRVDRPFIESIHTHLNARRPLATELYVIGCEYVELSVSIGMSVSDGFGRDSVQNAVRDALRLFLWPLSPGGATGNGWPLGLAVRERELEVIVARVPGVSTVLGVNLFEKGTDDWRMLPRANACALVEKILSPWQLPELLSVVVTVDEPPRTDLHGVPNPFGTQTEVAVPVVPEVC